MNPTGLQVPSDARRGVKELVELSDMTKAASFSGASLAVCVAPHRPVPTLDVTGHILVVCFSLCSGYARTAHFSSSSTRSPHQLYGATLSLSL